MHIVCDKTNHPTMSFSFYKEKVKYLQLEVKADLTQEPSIHESTTVNPKLAFIDETQCAILE